MNFWKNKKIFFITLFAIAIFPIVHAQVILTPPEQLGDNTTPLANEYYKVFDEVPNNPPLRIRWYETPNEIGRRIDLQGIAPATKYLEDDTPYLEKVINGETGRLFLKEVHGYKFTVLDLKFVPYIDAPKPEIEDDEQANDDEEEDEEEKDPYIVPSFAQRNSGKSIATDIILFINPSDPKRESLHRYNGEKKKLYEERYVYTKRGGIQRLTRLYSDGGIQRYVYYFDTGGLKEIFYQAPNGETYLLSYTLSGGLEMKLLYDKDTNITYEEYNYYDDDNELEEKIVRDYLKHRIIESRYKLGSVVSQKVYQIIEPQKEESSEQDNPDQEENATEAEDSETPTEEEQSSPPEDAEDDVDEEEKSVPQTIFEGRIARSQRKDIQEILNNRAILTTETFKYDEEGKQIEQLVTDILHETKSEIHNQESAEIESVYKNDILVKEIIHKEDERIEVFYFQGEQILRVYYNKTKKIKEEIFVNGELVETRISDSK